MPIIDTRKEGDYLSQFSLGKGISNAALWAEMDRVWDACGLDQSRRLEEQQDKVGSFYSHPVWILNGLFSEADALSLAHRKAIVNFIRGLSPATIADFGGGSGVLGKLIVDTIPNITLHIVEPYPSAYFVERNKSNPALQYTSKFLHAKYDIVIAQDVLEHVDDPVGVALQCIEATRLGGHVIFANCFWPVIKCHLPATFYLRHTFKTLMRTAGLQFVGVVPGAEHTQVFKRVAPADTGKVHRKATLLKPLGDIANRLAAGKAAIRSRMRKD